MPKFMLVAADSTRARIFTRAEKFSPLIEIEALVHPASRLRKQDLESDRPGRVFESMGHGESDNQPPMDAKQKELHRFAHEVADYLRSARVQHSYKGFMVVADPTFLGQLRKEMDDDTRAMVIKEVSRNVAGKTPDAIAQLVDQQN